LILKHAKKKADSMNADNNPDDLIHVCEYPFQGHRGMLTVIVDKEQPKDEPQPPEGHVVIDFIHQRNTI
jgi:hypothetical protein